MRNKCLVNTGNNCYRPSTNHDHKMLHFESLESSSTRWREETTGILPRSLSQELHVDETSRENRIPTRSTFIRVAAYLSSILSTWVLVIRQVAANSSFSPEDASRNSINCVRQYSNISWWFEKRERVKITFHFSLSLAFVSLSWTIIFSSAVSFSSVPFLLILRNHLFGMSSAVCPSTGMTASLRSL